ncbi:MAG: SpoIVB peptidase S55 domain-containing protein [Gemmataceae bacterium]
MSLFTSARWLLPLLAILMIRPAALAEPKPETYWQVDDIRPGMKGTGRTVLKGATIETFQAEVLGVLKNVSPGRDLVLCRLSGLELEKTGVIAGMSGSPVSIDGKLLGAVAYAWAFGKEPIAGVTPFSQMHAYVEAYERQDLVEQEDAPRRVGLRQPLLIDGARYDAVTVSPRFENPQAATADGMWLMPLRTPVAATGFTAHSLRLLHERWGNSGLLPVQGGGAGALVAEAARQLPLQPGGPLAVALVTGDFDLSGIGTVTHIEGKRVYGWGHPFLSLGTCDFPLMTGYIHTVYPRQTVSFKMGSPLRTVGVINADVSTGIAGWLDREPDLLPMRMKVTRDPAASKTFNVQIVRQPALLAALVFTVLTNSVDMEGHLPEEMTAELTARVEIAGQKPIMIRDTFSGPSYAGGRAPQALYSHVANIVNTLEYNSYRPLRIERIECETTVYPGRRTANIDAVELSSEIYSPGDILRAHVYLRPHKGVRQRVPLHLKLPNDLPEGSYTVLICDDQTHTRLELLDKPHLSTPRNLEQLLESLAVQTAAKRTNLVLRVRTQADGVALDEQALPDLPPSLVAILSSSRRTGAQPLRGALVSRHPTDYVLQGSESARFRVTKNKKLLTLD